MTTEPVFNLNHPEVRVSLGLSGDIRIGLRFRHQRALKCFHPAELTIQITHLAHHPASLVQLVQLQDHDPTMRIAAPRHDHGHALGTATLHMGFHPKIGRETSFNHGNQSNRTGRH